MTSSPTVPKFSVLGLPEQEVATVVAVTDLSLMECMSS